jgi:deoxyribodipyrimidine photo-lyase
VFQAPAPTIYWFRRDLRLAENAGFIAAAAAGPVVPAFIWSPEEEGDWAPGGASRWWLHHSLASLAGSLERLGVKLILRRGRSLEELLGIARETNAQGVYFERRYEPAAIISDSQVERGLAAAGLASRVFDGALLTDPAAVRTKGGRPFRVFTPFWRAAAPSIRLPRQASAPAAATPSDKEPRSLELADLELLPRIDWAAGLGRRWQPGEKGAASALRTLLAETLRGYAEKRDYPAIEGTSRLSPHLHFGEISVGSLWRELSAAREHGDGSAAEGIAAYLRQLGWREFAYHVLVSCPHTPAAALDPSMEWFPWVKDSAALRAWQRGLTGYPIVDAGMRELWTTGWMHNRVRMIVASFLVKDLLIDWRHGARWFWDTLVDADLANNTLGWQWAAGCGADAAPYFRVFNPVLQGQKFDVGGDYVRRWVPELGKMEAKWIHAPWLAPPPALVSAGVELGVSYPRPYVDHADARRRALDALKRAKEGPSRRGSKPAR